jgi:hypothetical protein
MSGAKVTWEKVDLPFLGELFKSPAIKPGSIIYAAPRPSPPFKVSMVPGRGCVISMDVTALDLLAYGYDLAARTKRDLCNATADVNTMLAAIRLAPFYDSQTMTGSTAPCGGRV